MNVQLYKFGTSGIPNPHLKRDRALVTLIVSLKNYEVAENVAEYLTQYKDGDIFLLTPHERQEDEESQSVLFDEKTDVSIFVADQGEAPLPTSIIHYLFKLNIKNIFSIDREFAITDYTRPNTTNDKILFVSPGSIYPLSLGSHQRMFNSLMGLLDSGISVSILFQEQNPEKNRAAKSALSLISSDVYNYKSARGKLKGKTKWKRVIHDKLTKENKRLTYKKQSFTEITQERSSYWLEKQLKEIAEKNSYSAIWINYAWMMGKMHQQLRSKFKHVICDTHDVQFYRNSKETGWLEKLILSPKSERKSELKELSKADLIIAISERDGNLLKEALPTKQVYTMAPAFGHLNTNITPRNLYTPLRFGFIGTKMEANLLALDYVFNNWWPSIHNYSPDSELLIAGNICLDPNIIRYSRLRDEIKILGFVENLENYYKNIDVLLSPVMIKGGLNFKNVEAIVAGVNLITNQAGAEALAPVRINAVETVDEVLSSLREIESSSLTNAEIRKKTQSMAMSAFGQLDIRPILELIKKRL